MSLLSQIIVLLLVKELVSGADCVHAMYRVYYVASVGWQKNARPENVALRL